METEDDDTSSSTSATIHDTSYAIRFTKFLFIFLSYSYSTKSVWATVYLFVTIVSHVSYVSLILGPLSVLDFLYAPHLQSFAHEVQWKGPGFTYSFVNIEPCVPVTQKLITPVAHIVYSRT